MSATVGSGGTKRTKSGAISRNQTGQHFWVSAKSRTLSILDITEYSEDKAHDLLMKMRWPITKGEPVCPDCQCSASYKHKTRRMFTCQACERQFSVTSGTIFHGNKLGYRKLLVAIFLYVNAVKGYAALELCRVLKVSFKTAFVLLHKLREAIGQETQSLTAEGEVEIDGAYVGGYIRPHNVKEKRIHRGLAANQNGKRQSLVVMRERGGRTLPFVASSESAAIPTLIKRIHPHALVFTDEAPSWNDLQHSGLERATVNHSECYDNGEACTNGAEGFFSRMRRSEIGIYHHISGPYLENYGFELGFKEDIRRTPNGTQFYMTIQFAMMHPPSTKWRGYWQRHRRVPMHSATTEGPSIST